MQQDSADHFFGQRLGLGWSASDWRAAIATRRRIEQTAQKILDVRKNYPDATYADLYDEISMPYDLRRAHRDNDRAVAVAYGFENLLNDETDIVAELLKLYNEVKHELKRH